MNTLNNTADSQLAKKLFLTKKELLDALTSGPAFYLEMFYIAFALGSAILVAILLRRRLAERFEKHPPRRIDVEYILRPMALLGPILAIFYLSIFKPFVVESGGGAWIDAVMRLSLAYAAAKCVTLIVRSRIIAYFIATIIMVVALLDVTGFTPSTRAYMEGMTFEVGKFKLSMLNLIHGTVILVLVFWMAGISSNTLESYLRRSSSMSYNTRELTVKFFRVLVYFIALMITLSAVGVDLTAFAVFGGALGVGIGLGLQKLTSNFVSGVTLLLEKSIKIGDLIEVAGITGWVRQLYIRYALVETQDGRELLIPNEELISTRVTNWTYTTDQARVEIPVRITYDSDPIKARELMLAVVRDYKQALKYPEPHCFLKEFTDLGMLFSLTFWIPDVKAGRAEPQSDVMFAILEKFRTNGIVMAYNKADASSKNLLSKLPIGS
jgi:small-conductance mechanosensitive channel